MTIYRLTQTSLDTQNRYAETVSKGKYFSRMIDVISSMMSDYLDITEERMYWGDFQTILDDKGIYISRTFYNIDDVEKHVMLSLKIEKIEVS
jgi:hypothetical protein